jgi:proline racemase
MNTPISTVDYHTAGEPFRIVVDGGPTIAGDTVLERREAAMRPGSIPDDMRALLCNEPRGHADMYGCFVVPPNDDEALFGALFWHKDGFSTACGHGTIALAVYAVDAGLVVAPDDGELTIHIDVPSGRVKATIVRADAKTIAVTFANVASFVVARSVEVVTSIGALSVDVSYGGAMYASARASDLGLAVTPQHLSELIRIGREIKAIVNGLPEAQHPTDARLSGIYGTIWFDDLGRTGTAGVDAVIHQRNCTVFADGEVDRSPCGSGTSARLALLHDSGAIAIGDVLDHESIIGSHFAGRVVARADEPRGSVWTEVTGMAYRTGEHRFVLDPADPIGLGFQLR